MAYSTFRQSGKPMNKVSPKRAAELDARDECRKAVIERDRSCQFPVLLKQYEAEHGAVTLIGVPTRCMGGLEVHEPAHRRNVDFTDPESCILSCWRHNQSAEDATGPLRELYIAMGWLIKGNGLPYAKRRGD